MARMDVTHTHIGPLDVVNVVFHTQRTNLAQLRWKHFPLAGPGKRLPLRAT